MKIRKLLITDIDSCVEMVELNFNNIYSNCRKDITEGLTDPKQFYKGIVVDDKLIGFCAYTHSNFTNNCYALYWVNIHPDYQNKGYGKKLIDKVLKEIEHKNIYNDIFNEKDKLWVVLTCKEILIQFYQNFNFKVCHSTDNKYMMLKEF